jgi:hypothetical protein
MIAAPFRLHEWGVPAFLRSESLDYGGLAHLREVLISLAPLQTRLPHPSRFRRVGIDAAEINDSAQNQNPLSTQR